MTVSQENLICHRKNASTKIKKTSSKKSLSPSPSSTTVGDDSDEPPLEQDVEDDENVPLATLLQKRKITDVKKTGRDPNLNDEETELKKTRGELQRLHEMHSKHVAEQEVNCI